MSTGSYFGDPWDDDDSSGPPSFFGNELKNIARWQAAGWGNPLLSPGGPPAYPGSLALAGLNLANVAGPSIRLAANGVASPSSEVRATADRSSPMPAPPYGPVPEEIKTQIGQEVEDGLERTGKTGGIIGPIMSKVPGLEHWGDGIDIIGKFLEDPAGRAWLAGHIRDWIVNDAQSEINRANDAYGQQQFINGGGMPHR
jgi:hypothetical protein